MVANSKIDLLNATVRCHFGRKAIGLLLLGFVCLQLTRVFLVVPIEWYECESAGRTSEDASLGSHHHHEEAQQLADHRHSDGNAFQHCKDTIDGLGLIPIVTFAPTPVEEINAPIGKLTVIQRETPRTVERDLRPPYQPPKYLS